MGFLTCFSGGPLEDHEDFLLSETEEIRLRIYEIIQKYEPTAHHQQSNGDSNTGAHTPVSASIHLHHGILFYEDYHLLSNTLSLLQESNFGQPDDAPICEIAREKMKEHENRRGALKEFFLQIVNNKVPGEWQSGEGNTSKEEETYLSQEDAPIIDLEELNRKLSEAENLVHPTVRLTEKKVQDEKGKIETLEDAYTLALQLSESITSCLQDCQRPSLLGWNAENIDNEGPDSTRDICQTFLQVGVRLGYPGRLGDFFKVIKDNDTIHDMQ